MPHAYGNSRDKIAIRTMTRTLEGLQKEAIVNDGLCGTAWRIVCDEGPWLNGTDLAPFPLAYYSAGMVSTLASEIVALAKQRDINIQDLRIIQDARYTMEGSAVNKTMTGTALPLEIEVMLKSSTIKERIDELVYHALAASPADAVMRTALPSRFNIIKNGQPLKVGKVRASPTPATDDPTALFNQIAEADDAAFATGIIKKLEDVDTSNAKPATAVGYAAEQKRMVKVRAVLAIQSDGLKSIQVQCIKPPGSVFNFLSDDPEVFGGRERAPSGLQYLSAGVAFCYMTQLGRFANIVKQDLESYSIVQDTVFSLPGGSAYLGKSATAEPVDTHVLVTSREEDGAIRLLVDMGEQTCYLHASYRGVAKTRLRLVT
ncbi:MAG: OsmC family peroxiredoxin [Gammaproteobacteria bacterium]